MKNVLWLPNGSSRISIKFHCNFELFSFHSKLDDHPGFRATNELFVFAGKRFPFERLILIRMDSQPACQKIIEITHIRNMFQLSSVIRVGTTPQDFNSFHIYEFDWEQFHDLKRWLTYRHANRYPNWNSQVCQALSGTQPLHNNLKFIKSFRSVPRHKSLNSNVNNH